jgi:tryptophan 2,3-dioxygenase
VNGAGNPYEEYLRIGELLELHSPRTEVPAEGLFFTVHQVSELWLATLLRELRSVRERLVVPDVTGAVGPLRLVVRVLTELSNTLDLLCSMPPTDFAAFRAELGDASAVQSRQYAAFIRTCRGPGPSVRSAFADVAVNAGGLGSIYRTAGVLRDVAELLVDVDDAFGEWKNRHVRLVRRQIGSLTGTDGGSADQLRRRTDERLFPELIDVRNELHQNMNTSVS